jgi:hypothetical protein
VRVEISVDVTKADVSTRRLDLCLLRLVDLDVARGRLDLDGAVVPPRAQVRGLGAHVERGSVRARDAQAKLRAIEADVGETDRDRESPLLLRLDDDLVDIASADKLDACVVDELEDRGVAGGRLELDVGLVR